MTQEQLSLKILDLMGQAEVEGLSFTEAHDKAARLLSANKTQGAAMTSRMFESLGIKV